MCVLKSSSGFLPVCSLLCVLQFSPLFVLYCISLFVFLSVCSLVCGFSSVCSVVSGFSSVCSVVYVVLSSVGYLVSVLQCVCVL